MLLLGSMQGCMRLFLILPLELLREFIRFFLRPKQSIGPALERSTEFS